MERQEIFGLQYLTVVVWKLKLLVIRLGQEARYQAAWPGDRHSEGESDHTREKERRDGGMQSSNYNQTCLGLNLGNLNSDNNIEQEEVSFNPS